MTDISKRIDKISARCDEIKSVTGRSRRTSRRIGAYWGRLERGERNPTLSIFSQIASALKVPLDCLQPKDSRIRHNYNELTDAKLVHGPI